VYPYWTEQYLQNPTAALFDGTLDALSRIQNITGNTDAIHYMIGETGWPTDGGGTYGDAVAGTTNAQTYFNTVVCPMLGAGFDVLYCEAFDEPLKGSVTKTLADGSIVTLSETAWGAMDVDRRYKLDMTCP
jgi:glucan 1,3-beta-glucosidase